jgi:AraC family transcriptional regulator
MKPDQRRSYADRIDRAVKLLEMRAEVGAAPNLAELAAAAALSEYHFHRIFRLMTGETVGKAVQRVRLARSVGSLATGERITVAAGASGYATSQSFARALRSRGGTSAREAKASARLNELSASFRSPQLARDSAPMRLEIVSVDPLRLLALRNVGDYAELNKGYTELFSLVLAQMPPESLQGIYGIPYDDPRFTPAAECRFDCALAVGGAGHAEGSLREMRVGPGCYLRLRHLGDYDALHESIDLAYVGALALLEREPADAPLVVHYLDDPEEVPEAELRSDIYLPLDDEDQHEAEA